MELVEVSSQGVDGGGLGEGGPYPCCVDTGYVSCSACQCSGGVLVGVRRDVADRAVASAGVVAAGPVEHAPVGRRRVGEGLVVGKELSLKSGIEGLGQGVVG